MNTRYSVYSLIAIALLSVFAFIDKTYSQTTVISDTVLIDDYIKKSQELVYSNTDSAIYYATRAENLAKKLDFKEREADAHFRHGVAHYVFGNYDIALVHYTSADSLFRVLNMTEKRAKTLRVLGLIHAAWENHERAIRFYNRSISLSEAYSDTTGLVLNFYNMGISFKDLSSPDSATYYFNRSKKLAVKSKDTLQIMRADMMMGTNYILMDEVDLAIKHLRQAEVLVESNNLWDYGYLLGSLAEAYLKKGEYITARNYAKKGLDIQQQLNAKWELLRLYHILAQLEAASNNYQVSVTYFKKYDAYRDTVFNERRKKAIDHLALIQQELDNEQLNAQNLTQMQRLENQQLWIGLLVISLTGITIILILIYHNNRIIKQLNQELKFKNQSLDEQDKFKIEIMAIVGHDMINMISSLAGFVKLIGSNDITKEEFAKISPSLEENIESIRRSFANLYRWADSYNENRKLQEVVFDPVSIFEETVDLFGNILEHQNIKLHIEYSERFKISMIAEHFRIVIRNLVHNAIKFTPAGGVITLFIEACSENKVRIGVKDTGKGMEPEIIQQILIGNKRFSQPGLRKEAGTGLGLITIKRLLNQQKSELKIESILGKGSVFYFELNVAGSPKSEGTLHKSEI